jgi:hypothetical protein
MQSLMIFGGVDSRYTSVRCLDLALGGERSFSPSSSFPAGCVALLASNSYLTKPLDRAPPAKLGDGEAAFPPQKSPKSQNFAQSVHTAVSGSIIASLKNWCSKFI